MNAMSDNKYEHKKLLAQNLTNSDIYSSVIDSDILDINESENSKQFQSSFVQCSKNGNIYSEEELNENLQEVVGSW